MKPIPQPLLVSNFLYYKLLMDVNGTGKRWHYFLVCTSMLKGVAYIWCAASETVDGDFVKFKPSTHSRFLMGIAEKLGATFYEFTKVSHMEWIAHKDDKPQLVTEKEMEMKPTDHIFASQLDPTFDPKCIRCGTRKSEIGELGCVEIQEKQEYKTLKVARQRWEYLDAKYGNPL